MTWRSHRAVTFTAVFLITHNIWFAVASMLGSTFPDKVEQPGFGSWQRRHRKMSHWFPVYVLVLCVVNLFDGQLPIFFNWFFIGCLAHILEDAVCGKVPLWFPGKAVKVFPRLFYTGSFKEQVFVGLFLVFCWGSYVLKIF